MFYTDGTIIIHDGNNEEHLAEAIEKIQRYLFDEKGISEIEIPFNESYDFPAYSIPKEISYEDIESALRPHLALKAINEDLLLGQDIKNVTVKYSYTEEDLRSIADKMSDALLTQMKIESEAKRVASEYKAKLKKIDDDIHEFAQNHSQGYEYRDYKTRIKYNFADKVKYYIDINEQETIRKTEPMEGRDFQLRIDHTEERKVVDEYDSERFEDNGEDNPI